MSGKKAFMFSTVSAIWLATSWRKAASDPEYWLLATASVPRGDEGHDHVRAHAVLSGEILGEIPPLPLEVAPEERSPDAGDLSDVGVSRRDLQTDDEVRGGQRRLQ
jgi:hypothetical protein